MQFDIDILTETDEIVELKEILENQKEIILYNDDYNTFQHVIETLIKYCEHDETQAEQCAYIVHYKGKCGVKRGTYNKLKPVCEVLLEKGLTAKIE